MTKFPDGAEYNAVIAVGSNIGDKASHIAKATRLLCETDDLQLVESSPVYKTPPWGITDQDWFANACFSVQTSLQPHDLLKRCLEVELQMGRERTVKWGPRVIDLDVLVYSGVCLSDDVLTVPHPHITERAFVLIPLMDVAPGLVLNGKPLAHWAAKVGREGIEALTG
ncbi:MAG: 2-amino-4-hydroxy-6-hydroxymethyldihydropteridine diphosphokinase [Pseudomonadota bacterium]